MDCGKCSSTIKACICPDIDTRLKDLSDSPYFMFSWCGNCDKHIDRCKCLAGVIGVRNRGTFTPALIRPMVN